MTLNSYARLNLKSGEAYLRRDRVQDLKRIDAIIFDCDGVLIDIRESYDKAISKSTAFIFEGLTGLKIPEDFISNEIIFLFRMSGGFNNDWDIVYGSLMFLLSNMPKGQRKKLTDLIARLSHIENPAKRFLAIREAAAEGALNISYSDLEILKMRLKDFTRLLDETGAASVDRAILSSGAIDEGSYSLIRDFINGSGGVGGSIVARIFEEIFCGPILFEDIYGINPEIYFGAGMIDKGKPIINRETLEHLSSLIRGPRFGIASGSRFKSAKHVLGDILNLFDQKAQVFLDDIEMLEDEYLKRGFIKVSLKKPNPYSLLKSSRSLEPFRLALFVGDSMEDVMAVERARRLDPRFIFAGVYEYTGLREMVREGFLKFKCDIILPSVNDIPYLIELVRGGSIERSGAL